MGTRSKELLVTWSPEGEDMAFVQFIQPHGVPQDKVIFITKLSEEIRDLAAQGAAISLLPPSHVSASHV